jgi:hypothetical protein
MIKNYTIYGERCTGTNYLEMLMKINFTIPITWEYGFKHFFGFHDEMLKKSNKTLFICIIRGPNKWINSLYRNPHHLQIKYDDSMTNKEKYHKFLNDEFWSFDDLRKSKERKSFFGHDEQQEIMEDRNIYTQERYKNLFEARYTKTKYLIEDLPKKVKYYVLIRYEDLIDDFKNTMNIIKNTGIPMVNFKHFPVNTDKYKKSRKIIFDKNKTIDEISSEFITKQSSFNLKFEQQLGYFLSPEFKAQQKEIKEKEIKKKEIKEKEIKEKEIKKKEIKKKEIKEKEIKKKEIKEKEIKKKEIKKKEIKKKEIKKKEIKKKKEKIMINE